MLIRVKLDLINWLLIYKNDYVSVEIINKLNAGIEGMLEKEGGRAQNKIILLWWYFWCSDFDLRNYKEAMHASNKISIRINLNNIYIFFSIICRQLVARFILNLNFS